MARVLIIDDDPDVRTVMDIILRKQGHEVGTASRLEEVFDTIESFQPTLILLDVLLSGADGRTICKDIKDRPATAHIPVIMFSAHPGAAENIANYGADDFISKPVNADKLLEKINNQISQSQQ